MLTLGDSLLNSAVSPQAARARLEQLRKALTDELSVSHPNQREVKSLVAEIAAMRAIVGPPTFFRRERDNAHLHRDLHKHRHTPRDVLANEYSPHAGKRQ